MPVHVVGQDSSPGVKRGGTLQIVEHTVELLVPSDAIPDYIEASVADLDIGSSVHILDIALPQGAKLDLAGECDPRDRRAAVRHARRGRRPDRRGRGSRSGDSACQGLSGRTFSTPKRPRRSDRKAGAFPYGHLSDAPLRRPRQSRTALCRQPAQHRLHGGGRDRARLQRGARGGGAFKATRPRR